MKAKPRRPMTGNQMASFKKRLFERRSRLAHGLRAQLTAVRHSGQRRVSDSIDIAANARQETELLQLAEMETQELKIIDQAIRRVDAATFETC